MARIIATESADIDAPPERVRAILVDYRDGHARILPRHFSDLRIESGGVGPGTVIRFKVSLMGSTRDYRGVLTEPQPGRVLVETYDSGEVTTFTLDPLEGGRRTRVTITTEWSVAGIAGFVTKALAPRMLRKVYAEELQNLARVAAEPAP